MGNNKFKSEGQFNCVCNQTYDESFPQDELPPPAPPNGREDLWELQFCRWWGWNWVRRKEVEATTYGTRKEEVKPENACRPSFRSEGRKFSTRQEPKSNYEPIQSCRQPVQLTALPPKTHFWEMCRCLWGKKQKPCGGIAKLYNTPSCSVVALKRNPCRPEKPPKIQKTKKKTKREKRYEDQAQSWSKASENKELADTYGSVANMSERLSCQRNASSTEDSIEYLSFRVQHIKSDMGCPCRKHYSPTTKQKKSQNIADESDETEIDVHVPQDHKETQTSIQVEEKALTNLEEKGCPCQKNYAYQEKMLKLKGKKHKTICICVCCCGACKPADTENTISKKYSKEVKMSLKSVDQEDPDRDRKVSVNNDAPCRDRKVSVNNDAPCRDRKVSVNRDGPCRDRKVSINSDNRSQNSVRSNNCSKSYCKEFTMTYPLIVPPSNTKMLSKFGTPSKNYHWMHSDATTTTLNNLENFKSPASGKTYEFATTCNIDTYEKYNLPELIDITEDLSYLKKLEISTNKSDNENRVLLDAVCDAILQEHDEKSLPFLNRCHLTNTSNDALHRDYEELELLCDLRNEFPSKSDINAELSKAFLNEDVGIQLTNPTSNQNVKFGDIGVITDIIKNLQVDSHVKKNEVYTNPRPFKTDVESKKIEPCFQFKGVDEKTDVFTRTGLLPSCSNGGAHKKKIKRDASNSSKGEKTSKKLKHEDSVNKANNLENNNNNNICLHSAEETNDRIGTIFTKIEDIVKQSKVKSAEIQKVLNNMPPKEASRECSESVLETHCLARNASRNDFKCGQVTGKDTNNCLRRNYKMSSDSFLKGMYPSIAKTGEDIINREKSYECFSDKLDNFLDEYSKCSANSPMMAPQIIFEEDGNSGQENNNSEALIYNKKESDKSLHLEKVSKLSIQSFIVCDEKSTIVQKLSGESAKTEKKTTKKKKKGSLIPIRKHSSSTGDKL